MTEYIKKKQTYITKKAKEPEYITKKSEPKAWITKKIRTHHFKSGVMAAGMRRFNRGGKV